MDSNVLTFRNLVQKGYLPKELPPPFYTTSLALAGETIIDDLPNPYDNNHKKCNKTSKATLFSLPNRNMGRRSLQIPNPLHQIQLCKTITDHWQQIAKFTNSSPISQSRLEVVPNSERAIVPISETYELWREVRKARIEASINARYLLKADITRFYESIYTHSIPWALHTKATAKVNRQRKDLYGNMLDNDIQRGQDGQTSGIPVGPDTSRIISEIIATAIDLVLKERLDQLHGIRFYDDYYLYFPTLVELEQAYSILQDVVRDYELTINFAKVEKIDIATEVFDNAWVNELRRFKFRSHEIAQYNDLIYYFDLTARLANLYQQDSVYFYALKKIPSESIFFDNWPMLESLLLRTLQVNTRPIHVILEIFLRNKDKNFDKEKIQNALGYFIMQHAKLGNSFEVSWGLWFLRSLSIQLPAYCLSTISTFDNPIVALIALDLEQAGLINGKIEKDLWKQRLIAEGLYDRNWLLVYEASIKGWLSSNSTVDFIKDDPFFAKLRENNISFYDAERQLRFKMRTQKTKDSTPSPPAKQSDSDSLPTT